MRYKNAAEILPEDLLKELQLYIDGELLYVTKAVPKKEWGIESGSKSYYLKRNKEIRQRWGVGVPVRELAKQYSLAESTIKKIIYQQ